MSSTSVLLNVRTDTTAKLDRFCGTGRIKRDVLARLVDWFVEQPLAVQQAVLGEVPEDDTILTAYARVLKHLAGQLQQRVQPGGQRSSLGETGH